MITKFKLFEKININNGEPNLNDYVITNQHNWENFDPNDPSFDEYQKNYLESIKFTDTHIGRIHFIDKQSVNEYIIKYKYVPDHLKGHFNNSCIQITRDELKYWSKNKEDLSNENIKIFSNIKKYNI